MKNSKKIYNFRTPPDPASQIWGLQTQIWVQESPRSGQKSGKSGSEILGSGILGSWDLRSWDLGSWGPGILGSWDPGILGSWDLGSWGLGSWDTENSKLPKSLTSLILGPPFLGPTVGCIFNTDPGLVHFYLGLLPSRGWYRLAAPRKCTALSN